MHKARPDVAVEFFGCESLRLWRNKALIKNELYFQPCLLYPFPGTLDSEIMKYGDRAVTMIQRALSFMMPHKYKKFRRSSRFFVLSVFLFILVSNSLLSLDSRKNLDEYMLRTWTVQSGLPLNTITSLSQTRDGYIWVGTLAGLSRFDGIRFETFTKQNSPLTSDRISSLCADSGGVLWIGTEGGGLYSCEKGDWNNITTEDGLSNGNVRAIITDWKGGLWVGTDYGLNHVGRDGIRVYTEEHGLYDNIITALCLDNWGTLWIGTLQGGLARYDEGMTAVYGYEDGLLNLMVRSLAADRLGNIWIGTLEGLYVLGNGTGIIRYVPGTRYAPISSILEDNSGNLWMGTTDDGLNRMSGDALAGMSTDNGLPDDFIRCLLIDRDENIWIGTDAGGLVQLRDPVVTSITGSHGLPESAVSAVMGDRRGFLWVGTRSKGLCRIKDGRIAATFDTGTGIFSDRIRSILEDSDGDLWVGSEDRGIAILKNGRWSRLGPENGLSSNNVTALLQDRPGDIWIGTDKGLDRFRDGMIDPPGPLAGLEEHHVHVLLKTRDESILAGTTHGLFEISELALEKKELAGVHPEPEIVSLFEDEEGILWIGTNGEGLMRHDGRQTTVFTTEAGLRDNYIYSLTEDGSGNLWMSTNRGVMRMGLRALNDFAEGKIRYVTPSFFDEAEGMASSQCSGQGQPSVWKDDEGRLYFPTVKGVSVFDPANIGVRSLPPLTVIETVACDGDPGGSPDALTFFRRPGSIAFHFTGFDFLAPEKIHFKYKLEGHDEDFIHLPLDGERTARYVNLAPGEYRFTVKAASNDGIWDENGAFFAFAIRPSFFQKPVFYVLVVLTLLLSAGSVLLIGNRRRQKRRRDKYKTIPIDAKRIADVSVRLLHLLDEERLFLDPDLTLKKLSLRLKVHYNHLSRIINERFGLSYNDFINKYRIEEAKRKLAARKEKGNTVLDIAYSTGFYSKSVFNAAFKKFTGMTPTEYRKKHLEKSNS